MDYKPYTFIVGLSFGAMLSATAMDSKEIPLTSKYSSFTISPSYYDNMSNKEIIDRLPNEDENGVALQVIATRFGRGFVALDSETSSALKVILKGLEPRQMTNDQIYMELKLVYKEWFSSPRPELINEITRRRKGRDPSAFFLEGWLWKKGFGVSKDEKKAREFLEEAARLNNPLAVLALAKIKYREGDCKEEGRLRLNAWEKGWPAGYYNCAKLRLEKHVNVPCFLYYSWAAEAGHQKSKNLLKAKVEESKIIWCREGERPTTLIPTLEIIEAMVKGLYNLNLWHIIGVSPRSAVAEYENMGHTLVNFITFTNFINYFHEHMESPYFGLPVAHSDDSCGGMIFEAHHKSSYLFFSPDPKQPGSTLELLKTGDSFQQYLSLFLREYRGIAELLKKGATMRDESCYLEGLYAGSYMERPNTTHFRKFLLFQYINTSSEGRNTILKDIDADLSFLQYHLSQQHTSCRLFDKIFVELAPYRGYLFMTKVIG